VVSSGEVDNEVMAATIPESDASATAPASRSTLAAVARSGGTRLLVLPVSAILGIVNTRLIIENFGTAAFAQYGLLVTIGTLLPFADLGMAAAVMNAVGSSDRPATDPHVQRTITTSIRILLASAAVMLLIVATISVFGWWPTLLGDGLLPGPGPLAAALCIGLIAVSLPVGIGQRVLSGLGKNHIAVFLMGLQTPVVVLCVYVMVKADTGGGGYIPVIPYISMFLISVGALWAAGRHISPSLGRALRDVPRRRQVPGTRVFDVAWPMLIQMIALPIAMQTDRLVLSHLTDTTDLGEYNLAAQMYLPIWQVTSAAGVALWPIFARARARGGPAPSPLKLSAAFAGAAAACGAVIGIASPWLARLASDGRIRLPWGLVIAFAIFMVVQAAKYPLGIYMTDAAGLRYQAMMIVLMLPVNLGISLVLAQRYGAIGPVIGSAIGVSIFQFGANYRYARRARAATS
jgi:O-antigen/teichoic acid export membrane protein